MTATTARFPLSHFSISYLSRQINLGFQHHPALPPWFAQSKDLKLYRNGLLQSSYSTIHAVYGGKEEYVSPWDDKPFEILPSGKKAYLDEQDVATFLDPPKELIPLDSASYNPAAYLWKKIEDIPEERRHRLLHLLNPMSLPLFPCIIYMCVCAHTRRGAILQFLLHMVLCLIDLCRLISRAWQIAGTRYEDSKLVKKAAAFALSTCEDNTRLEYYNCRSSGGSMPISWINFFKKAIFSCKDGNAYGRLIGESVLSALASSFAPLYFTVRQVKEVMSTEQPCDFAYEFGDGLFQIQEVLPRGFPKPMKHPYPFNDEVLIYVRHLGPGVLVGQAWQEGNELEQVPQKLCGEILMVKDYYA